MRENQIAGYVLIDKKNNAVLQDMANRQGLDENIYYQLFVEIILIGIKEFERYRQSIIRKINKKNKTRIQKATPISDRVISKPISVSGFTKEEAIQAFDPARLSASPSMFDNKRLLWTNSYYIKHVLVYDKEHKARLFHQIFHLFHLQIWEKYAFLSKTASFSRSCLGRLPISPPPAVLPHPPYPGGADPACIWAGKRVK